MVAYSFRPIFAADITALRKRQTVRGDRRRHALAGEPIQLYTGMRTKRCRKLLAVDPIVTDVRQIAMRFEEVRIRAKVLDHPAAITSIVIDGVPLSDAEMVAFAVADGFASTAAMAAFWHLHHGSEPFEGVVIRWDAASQ